MAETLALLIVDPQQDFCGPQGALSVGGAAQDVARLAAFVRRRGADIGAVHVTLDSHHWVDVAHPVYWQDAEGRHPAPFTLIPAAEVESGRWRTADPAWQARALAYVRALEAGRRYQLCIWPPHCLIGSPGHAVAPELFAALCDWEQTRLRPVNYVRKGENIHTEHYSAIQAEVPDPADPATRRNAALVDALRRADRVIVAGEAGSHCVAATVRDMVDAGAGDAVDPHRLTLLARRRQPRRRLRDISGRFPPRPDHARDGAGGDGDFLGLTEFGEWRNAAGGAGKKRSAIFHRGARG